MKFKLIILEMCLFGVAHPATLREVFSNSAVHLSYALGTQSSSGSGLILLRPNGVPNADSQTVQGRAFLVTNKHVLPPEGTECNIAMRVTTISGGAPSMKAIDIPIVGADGKYLATVHFHSKNDVAAVEVTGEVLKNSVRPEFVPTTLLGTKARIKSDVGLVGDDVYILGYPAGLFDSRNANPIWRIGIVATSPLEGYAFPEALQTTWHLPSFVDGFLVDSQVYPGSSGSVVVNKPHDTSFDRPGVVMAGGPMATPYVLGIISDSIPIIDNSLHLITRMGLGVVQSADAINETVESFFK
jgi:hypothetical protein